jgi:hypothetical protein
MKMLKQLQEQEYFDIVAVVVEEADPVAVSKLAKKLKKMRNQRRNVMQQIDQYYYLYEDEHHGMH